jgi:hypothetical protein
MWALALAVTSVLDIPYDLCAWTLVDSDGMPFIAVTVDGEAEGELADGHAKIRLGVVETTTYGRHGRAMIDVNEDAEPDAIVPIMVFYDDGRSRSEIAIYTVEDGELVPIHRFLDDVPGWSLASVSAEDRRLIVERVRFRSRTVRVETWTWDGDGLVEDRSRRARHQLPKNH